MTSHADVHEVMLQIESEEILITPVFKLCYLIRLWYGVYRTRSVSFHWHLSTVVKMKGYPLSHGQASSSSESKSEETFNMSRNAPSYKYPLHTFVDLKAQPFVGTYTNIFLIGEVLESCRVSSNYISKLSILWHVFNDEKCKLTCILQSSKFKITMKTWRNG